MKIAYVVTRADAVGGASIHVRDLAIAMRERGHEVLVLVGGTGQVTQLFGAAEVPFLALRYLRRPIHPVRDMLARRELSAALQEFGPDLISTHTAKAGWIGRAAAARLQIPAVHTPHGWPFGERFSGVSGAVFAAAERRAARWCRAVICVSESEKRLALVRGLARPDQLYVVHNGVRDVPPEFRAAAECEPPNICCIARFAPPKDHATLLVALKALQSRAWSLDLIGEGPTERRMWRLADQLGIAERVNFRGYLEEPEPVLAASQLFVLSTRSEAFPRSVLEAMRAGLPVIASDVGGVREAVEDGRTGLLVRPEEALELAGAIDSLLAGAQRRRELGAAGRHAYEQRFRLDRTVEQTLAVYRVIMDA